MNFEAGNPLRRGGVRRLAGALGLAALGFGAAACEEDDGLTGRPDAVAENLVTVEEDGSVRITLGGLDPALREEGMAVRIVQAPSSGTVAADGPFVPPEDRPNIEWPTDAVGMTPLEVTYTPTADYNGSDDFAFEVWHPELGPSRRAFVSVEVTAVNDAPVAADDVGATPEDTPLRLEVLNNDTDIDDGAFAIAITAEPTSGTVEVSGDGTILYTPNENYPEPELTGTDTFSYSITDHSGASAEASVTVTVNAVNDRPRALSDAILSVLEDAATPATISLSGEDNETAVEALEVEIIESPRHGSLNGFEGNAPLSVGYTPQPDFFGVDQLVFVVTDGNGDTSAPRTVRIEIQAENDPPVAIDDAATTAEDTPVTIEVLANDTDVDDSILSVRIVEAPANGRAEMQAGGVIVYTPNLDYDGASDTLRYEVSDLSGATAEAAVALTIEAVNDAPSAMAVDPITLDEDPGAAVAIPINGSDIEPGTLRMRIIDAPSLGTVDRNSGPVPLNLMYMPNAHAFGDDSFTFEIVDSAGLTSAPQTVNLRINSVNDAPVALDDTADTLSVFPLMLTPLTNDQDVDDGAESLTIVSIDAPDFGTATLLPGGVIDYRPEHPMTGMAALTYTVRDPAGATDTATIRIEVTEGQPVVIGNFRVEPDLVVRGESANLRWSTTAADSCTVSPGIGPVVTANGTGPNPTLPVTPDAPTTYTLTCAGPLGPVSSSVTLHVSDDTDGDFLPDGFEFRTGTDPFDADSDDDGIIDSDEDVDRNGIVDPGETDPRSPDTDGDGWCDGARTGEAPSPADDCTAQERIFVTPGGTGDGSSWEAATGDLQAAADAAQAGQEVWVTAGTFRGAGAEMPVLVTHGELMLYGGFAGSETAFAQRPVGTTTRLEGDFAGDDDPQDPSTRGENALHVVIGTAGAHLDGLTIAGGHADGDSALDRRGAGLEISDQSGAMMLHHVSFMDNQAVDDGAAISVVRAVLQHHGGHLMNNAAFGRGGAIFLQSTEAESFAAYHGYDLRAMNNSAAGAGGVVFASLAELRLARSHFRGNSAGASGGVIHGEAGATLVGGGLSISDNEATVGGGALAWSFGRVQLTSVELIGNSTPGSGGAVWLDETTAWFANITSSGNSAEVGGMLYARGATDLTVVNGLFWGDMATTDPLVAIAEDADVTLSVSYTCAEADLSALGENNVTAAEDPRFIAASGEIFLDPNGECVDIGWSAPVEDGERGFEALGLLGWSAMTTMASGMPDAGAIDPGYHRVPGLWIATFEVGATEVSWDTNGAELCRLTNNNDSGVVEASAAEASNGAVVHEAPPDTRFTLTCEAGGVLAVAEGVTR